MTAVMSCNINDVDDDIFNKQYLYIIKVMLKSRSADMINCYDNNIINKYVQVVNSAVKECRDLLLLMCYKMTRNFLLN